MHENLLFFELLIWTEIIPLLKMAVGARIQVVAFILIWNSVLMIGKKAWVFSYSLQSGIITVYCNRYQEYPADSVVPCKNRRCIFYTITFTNLPDHLSDNQDLEGVLWNADVHAPSHAPVSFFSILFWKLEKTINYGLCEGLCVFICVVLNAELLLLWIDFSRV